MERAEGTHAAADSRGVMILAVAYGLVCHLAFGVAVAAMIVVLFSGMTLGLGRLQAPWSWIADAVLLLQFPVLHTALLSRRGMAMLRRIVPGTAGAPLLSTTYALIASLQTGALFLGWTPSHHMLWQARGAFLIAFEIAYTAAWLVLGKAILDAGADLQTGFLGWWAVVRGRLPVYPSMPTRGLFRWCRQPIYFGFALTLWTVPTITPDGLAVALVLTGYCLIGPLFKEARFSRRFGDRFAAYRAGTPYWLPWPRRRRTVIAERVDAPAE